MGSGRTCLARTILDPKSTSLDEDEGLVKEKYPIFSRNKKKELFTISHDGNPTTRHPDSDRISERIIIDMPSMQNANHLFRLPIEATI